MAAAGTATASYRINDFGQPIVKAGTDVRSVGAHGFVYDGQGSLLGEDGGTSAIIDEAAYLPGRCGTGCDCLAVARG